MGPNWAHLPCKASPHGKCSSHVHLHNASQVYSFGPISRFWILTFALIKPLTNILDFLDGCIVHNGCISMHNLHSSELSVLKLCQILACVKGFRSMLQPPAAHPPSLVRESYSHNASQTTKDNTHNSMLNNEVLTLHNIPGATSSPYPPLALSVWIFLWWCSQ